MGISHPFPAQADHARDVPEMQHWAAILGRLHAQQRRALQLARAAGTRGEGKRVLVATERGNADAIAASALRRCLDFGVLDEDQALALSAPGAGLLEGALECIAASGDVGADAFGFRRVSPAAARFALDGASSGVRFDDDDDVLVWDANPADEHLSEGSTSKDLTIPAETALCAAIRTLVALASTSATAARAAASAAFSFPADTTAGGGDGDPIAALAALAREIGSRDRATIDVRFGRTSGPLAVAVCEAVAVLAGASRAARRAFAREEGVVAAFRSVVSGADQRVAAAAAAAAASLGAG